MRNDDPARLTRDGHEPRIQRLEIAGEDAVARIQRLERYQEEILKALAKGATTMALLQRDVRSILWVAGGIAVPILGALGVGLVKAMAP